MEHVVVERRAGVLPEGVVGPTAGQGPDLAGVARDPQRVGVVECGAVSRAPRPPVVVTVDDGVTAGQLLIGGDEVVDPIHQTTRGLAVAVVVGAVRVVLDVQHAGQRFAVGGPATTVLDEEAGLFGATGGVGVAEVVGPADHSLPIGAGVLRVELLGSEVLPLSGLDVGEANAAVPLIGPVDIGLVAGDVDAPRTRGPRSRLRGERPAWFLPLRLRTTLRITLRFLIGLFLERPSHLGAAVFELFLAGPVGRLGCGL